MNKLPSILSTPKFDITLFDKNEESNIVGKKNAAITEMQHSAVNLTIMKLMIKIFMIIPKNQSVVRLLLLIIMAKFYIVHFLITS